MSARTHAILLLKEDPKGEGPDAYRNALAPLLKDRGGEGDNQAQLDYLAPLAPVCLPDTLLHSAIQQRPEAHHIWALVFTSQNGVKAFEQCAQSLATASSSFSSSLTPTRSETTTTTTLDAWLSLPVFCLSGSTLKAVERAGFRTIYGRDFETLDSSGRPLLRHPTVELSSPTLGNASQLSDVLLSLCWPANLVSTTASTSITPAETTATTETAAPSSSPPLPELWLLTGETHMPTLRERLQQQQQLDHRVRPLREVEVYRTDPQPDLEDKLAAWIEAQLATAAYSASSSSSSSSSSSPSSPSSSAEISNILWLVGFSPKGVDLAWSGLDKVLTTARAERCRPVLIQWAAIGQTTAARIRERIAQQYPTHLYSGDAYPPQAVLLSQSIAIAEVPKPEHLAKAMQEHLDTWRSTRTL